MSFKAYDKVIDLEERKASLNRKKISGKVILITVGLAAAGFAASSVYNSFIKDDPIINEANTNDTMISNNEPAQAIVVSSDEIPSGAIVNDGSDAQQLMAAVKKLNDDGIKCQYLDSVSDIDNSDAYYYIAFQNYGGDDVKIITDRNVSSISGNFTMAIASGYGKEASDIQPGVYDQNSNLVASNIENTVGDRLIPHVMIAQPYDLEIDYASIEDGLARMTEFLKVNEDGAYAPSAIYVTKAGDSVSSLGEDICGYNNIGSSDLINENVVLKAEDYWWFNQSTIVTIDRVNEINHTL